MAKTPWSEDQADEFRRALAMMLSMPGGEMTLLRSRWGRHADWRKGDDTLDGGNGDDLLVGGQGSDAYNLSGEDTIQGYEKGDTIVLSEELIEAGITEADIEISETTYRENRQHSDVLKKWS